jgi:hypothetical protein
MMASGRNPQNPLSNLTLGDHPKPANGDHLKSGQRIH